MTRPLSRHERFISAMLSGIAKSCVHVQRATRDEALAEIAERLLEVEEERRGLVLTDSAVRFNRPGDETETEHRLVAELLGEAGADLEEARRIWHERHRLLILTESGRKYLGTSSASEDTGIGVSGSSACE